VKSIFCLPTKALVLSGIDRILAVWQTPIAQELLFLGDNMEEKRCSKCGEVKPVREFGRQSRNRDGLQSRCRACERARRKAYYEANKEKERASQKVYCDAHREEACARSMAHYYADLEKSHAKNKAYYDANREECCARQVVYREADPDPEGRRASQRVYQKVYRLANLEKECARKRVHYEANLEKYRANGAKRRARKNGADGQATAEQIAARWDYYGGQCYICGAPADATDHVIPLDKGGSNWPANLRPICKRCNSVKGPKWPYDFEQARLEVMGSKCNIIG